MVAYIFLFYLVKHLDQDPINGYFSLDIGFTCYTLFCWGSTISSLGVHPPPDRRGREPSAPKTFGVRGTIVLMLIFEAIFLLCFVLGLSWRLASSEALLDSFHFSPRPCLKLRLEAKILEQHGLPEWQISAWASHFL